MFNNKRGRRNLYIVISVLSVFFILSISYFVQLSKLNREFELLITSDNFTRVVDNINNTFDIDFYLPHWESFWQELSIKIYSLIGYDVSLVLDLLQASIVFLTGMGFVNALVFRTNDPTKFGLNGFFYKIYFIAFIILLILVAIYFYKNKKSNTMVSNSGKLKRIGVSFMLIVGTVIMVPFIVFAIDLAMLSILKYLFPLVANVLFGVDVLDENSLLGQYTLSTIIFNSSFKDQMGSYVYVPSPESLFPGKTYEMSIVWKLVDLDVTVIDKDIAFTINGKSQQVVDSINFFLLYTAQISVAVLLTIVAIKITKCEFQLFMLLIAAPVYFASTVDEDSNSINEWKSNIINSSKIILLTIATYLIFTLTIPALLTALSYEEIESFRDVNWLGVLNIIVIISGLWLTINISKIIEGDKKNKKKEKITINANGGSSSSDVDSNKNDRIFE